MGVQASESTVRRWIHRRFPQLPSAVVLHATIAGEVMKVDYGYIGTYWDRQSGTQRKAWFFSGRLHHFRRVCRQIAFNQSQSTFFRCHVNAFEFLGGVSLT
jgi:transposase